MTSQSDTSQPIESQAVVPAGLAESRPLYWSVRRELWENRFLYVAPLVVTALVLFASFVSMVTAKQQARVLKALSMAPAPIMMATLIIGVFYCLDALYGERRDRSILFWKSLPVSDRATVLAKASIPLIVLPLIAYVLCVISQIILLVLTAPVLAAKGLNPWAEFEFFEGLVIMFYGLAVHALWYAPIYGWLLLVSAWARRSPVLWAVLPLMAVSVVERIVFNSMHFMAMLQYRVGGAMKEAFVLGPRSDGDFSRLTQLSPGRFLSSSGLWVGLIFAAIFLAAAVRLRRHREPI